MNAKEIFMKKRIFAAPAVALAALMALPVTAQIAGGKPVRTNDTIPMTVPEGSIQCLNEQRRHHKNLWRWSQIQIQRRWQSICCFWYWRQHELLQMRIAQAACTRQLQTRAQSKHVHVR